jgi:fimbrial chaperone protein
VAHMQGLKKNNISLQFYNYIKIINLALVLILFLIHPTVASELDVKPIRIFFDAQNKIEKLVVTNGAEKDCTVQIRVFQWTQDEKGKELYSETKDILIYPKIVTIKKEEEKIIRIATKLKSEFKEKTFRIYVEELPSGKEEETKKSVAHIYLKIGVPVFISPIKKEEKGAIEAITLEKGTAKIKVTNNGTKHFIISGIQVKGQDKLGKEVFAKDLSGWYLLSGASRVYETVLPKDICKEVSSLDVEVKTNINEMNFQEQLLVEKMMCDR